MYPPYLQIQFISVILSIDELVIIRSFQKSNFRRSKKQQRQVPKKKLNSNNKKKKTTRMAKMRARFQGSPRHEETKNIARIRKRVKKAFHCKVTVFKELINSGPYYIYAFSDKVFSLVESFDGNFYICMTWGKKLKKNCIHGQVVYNQLDLGELPKEFRNIRSLDEVLVAGRLLFKKISIIPKGQSPKLKGALLCHNLQIVMALL